jgi:hypothetical protein
MHARFAVLDRRGLAAAGALAAFGASAWAEGPQDRYWAELEYFFPTISSTARLDGAVRGTAVSLEDELGLSDRKGTPYLLLGMRLGESWRLEFEYYTLNRDASKQIGRDIQWGDIRFPVSATLNSEFDSTIYRLTAGWSFYRTPRAEGGASIGLHVTDFTLQLSGQGNGPAGLAFQREKRDQTVPLPTIGLYGNYMVTDQWILRGRVDYLSLNYDNYDGSLINWLAAVEWRFHKNWGAGLGYRYVDYKLEATKESFHGEVNYKFQGPTLYIGAAF